MDAMYEREHGKGEGGNSARVNRMNQGRTHRSDDDDQQQLPRRGITARGNCQRVNGEKKKEKEMKKGGG